MKINKTDDCRLFFGLKERGPSKFTFWSEEEEKQIIIETDLKATQFDIIDTNEILPFVFRVQRQYLSGVKQGRDCLRPFSFNWKIN